MRHFIFYPLFLILITSCGNKGLDPKSGGKSATDPAGVRLVVGIGKIEPENDIIQLASPVSGIVSKICKKENDQVKTGEPILELDHQIEDAKVLQLTNALNTQAAQIKADEAAVYEYQAKFDNALLDLKRMQELLHRGAETQQTYDNANTNLKVFESNLQRLKANLQGSRSKLGEANAALTVARMEAAQKIIKSPVNGKILEITTLPGSAVDNRQAFAQISPDGKTIALCEVDELYAGKIANGQKAWVRNPGSSDTLSTGTIFFTFSFLKKKSLFTDQSGEKEDRRVRAVKILLDHPEKLLLNARVECVIVVPGN
jgi:multidrug efflux pump subunit AcrA (membrane-fusion protein)